MPNASAPNAPWVEVCESPQTTVMPGWVRPELRADQVHDALVGVAERVEPDAELGAVVAQRLDLGAARRVGDRLVDVERRDVVVLGRDREVRAGGPGGRRAADRRTPAGWSPRAPGAGRCRAGRARRRCPAARRARPRPSRPACRPSSRSVLSSFVRPGAWFCPALRSSYLHLRLRDGSIDPWTTLAESASWTRPPRFSAPSRPGRPPSPSSSPPPAWPARRRTGSPSPSSTTGSSPATCRAGSSSARGWPSSPRPPARTGCSPPPGRC